MSRLPKPVFLERRTYRRRRLMDFARFLPVVGLLLFLVPLMWTSDGAGPSSTARGVIYIFAIWAGLILAAAWMAPYLARRDPDVPPVERPE